MPSPLGHFLAGLSVGIATDSQPPPARRPLSSYATPFSLLAVAMAAAPDIDLMVPDAIEPHFHRTATHSITAVVLLFIVSMFVTGQVTPQVNRWRVSAILALAWATHLLMDWLGADPSIPSGIQLLWPFSERTSSRGSDWFPAIERDIHASHFLVQNTTAAIVEIVVGVPLVAFGLFINARRGAARAGRVLVEDR
ncbi:MAG: metal-dependent hydrolase [Vicinamibacterales bacterium]